VQAAAAGAAPRQRYVQRLRGQVAGELLFGERFNRAVSTPVLPSQAAFAFSSAAGSSHAANAAIASRTIASRLPEAGEEFIAMIAVGE
jgi:hypothetical protein